MFPGRCLVHGGHLCSRNSVLVCFNIVGVNRVGVTCSTASRRTAKFRLKVPRTIKRVLSAQGFLIIGIAGTGQGIDFSSVRRLSAVLGSRAGYGLRALHKFH